MNELNKKINISDWAAEDQPRERLITWGKHTASNVELLSIIIGTGSRGLNAMDMAQQILDEVENDLLKLSKMKLEQLIKFRGIGKAKAVNIIVSFELARRIKDINPDVKPKFKSSKDGFTILKHTLGDLQHEEFWILLLSRSNRLIKKERISIGGVSSTLVDPKIIFSKAINHLASSIILAHNHPSGNLKPSRSDKELTRKLVQAAKLFDMEILDHLIISENRYYSFADAGILRT